MSSSLGSFRFYRRPDLSLNRRLSLVHSAVCHRSWGNVTALSKEYGVSRTFIYGLIKQFTSAISSVPSEIKSSSAASLRVQSLKAILKLRLEGCCSIEAIDAIAEYFEVPFHSVGFISQSLEHLGTSLGNKLCHDSPSVLQVVVCSDEIFYKGHPILITVEPVSMAILQIDLGPDHKADTWKSHWSAIMESFEFSQITKDQGTGMSCAHAQLFPEIPCQSDTFHAVAHRLGIFKNRFLKAAYAAIEAEYEQERLFYTAKTEETLQKRYDKWVLARNKSIQAVQLFEHFSWLYAELLACFDVFDKNGETKDKATTVQTFECALQLLYLLDDNGITKELQSIQNCTNQLFHFVSVAHQVVEKLQQKLPQHILSLLCTAWQNAKKAVKSKDAKKKSYHKEKEKMVTSDAQYLLSRWDPEAKYDSIVEEVSKELDKITQSSAAVECINSILRTYLNTCKNQPSKAMLNLFMFYHNHRRFRAGKRKGKTPYEILTDINQQEEWSDMLLAKVA
jgi:hypothetical protein